MAKQNASTQTKPNILKDWAAKNERAIGKTGWIIGSGYDDSQLAEQRHPTAAELDKVSTEVPVIFIHQSGHLGAMNHKALAMAGYGKDTKDPAGGVIRRVAGSTGDDQGWQADLHRGSRRQALMDIPCHSPHEHPPYKQGVKTMKAKEKIVAHGQPITAKLNAGIDADAERLIGIFKDIHQNPELGFMETRTAGIVAKELKALGYEVKTGIGKTGVVGVMKNGDGPIVMYRADMDCNAVKEATGLPYASTKTTKRKDAKGQDEEAPVMHACGHDAHTTWLMGVGKAFAENKSDWKGTLVLIAQPAEELILGAKAMVQDGMYEKGVPKPDYQVDLDAIQLGTKIGAASVAALFAK